MVRHNIVLYRPILISQVPLILQSNAGNQLTFMLPFKNFQAAVKLQSYSNTIKHTQNIICILLCLFFSLLCSKANKVLFCPGHWYGPIKGCDQPERFNDVWDAGVDRLIWRRRKIAYCVRVCLLDSGVLAQCLYCRQLRW